MKFPQTEAQKNIVKEQAEKGNDWYGGDDNDFSCWLSSCRMQIMGDKTKKLSVRIADCWQLQLADPMAIKVEYGEFERLIQETYKRHVENQKTTEAHSKAMEASWN